MSFHSLHSNLITGYTFFPFYSNRGIQVWFRMEIMREVAEPRDNVLQTIEDEQKIRQTNFEQAVLKSFFSIHSTNTFVQLFQEVFHSKAHFYQTCFEIRMFKKSQFWKSFINVKDSERGSTLGEEALATEESSPKLSRCSVSRQVYLRVVYKFW